MKRKFIVRECGCKKIVKGDNEIKTVRCEKHKQEMKTVVYVGS